MKFCVIVLFLFGILYLVSILKFILHPELSCPEHRVGRTSGGTLVHFLNTHNLY